MSIGSEIALISLIGGAVSFGWLFGYKFLNPEAKAREYINWFKIGRVKQFAEEKNIDIEELIVKDELMQVRKAKSFSKLQDSWTRRISLKLAEELEPIEKELDLLKDDKKK